MSSRPDSDNLGYKWQHLQKTNQQTKSINRKQINQSIVIVVVIVVVVVIVIISTPGLLVARGINLYFFKMGVSIGQESAWTGVVTEQVDKLSHS